MDEINGVLGICPGGWSLKCLSPGARRYNRKYKHVQGGIYKSVPGRWGSGGSGEIMSKGSFLYCPGVCLQLLSSTGGGCMII